MRIFAISDIHVDHLDNWSWIEQLSPSAFLDDVLILAGDVSHRMDLLQKVFQLLLSRFQKVFFVPGNHELWVMEPSEGDSLQKFHAILQLCKQMGISCEAEVLTTPAGKLRIVPLFSWYTRPEEGPDSLYVVKKAEDPNLKIWSDDHLIRWPTHVGKSMTHYFLQLNRSRLCRNSDETVISFSHFLPRLDLIFSTTEEDQAFGGDIVDGFPPFNFSRVAGTSLLDEQIRLLQSRIHLYGHQHRNRYRITEGIRYVSHCLGYGRERENQALRHIEGGLRLIWDGNAGEERSTFHY